MIRIPSATAFAMALIAGLISSPSLAERSVTVLFTNDIESAYDPVEAFWRDDMSQIGGIPQLATLINEVRAATSDPVFLFDAGDIFTGSLARQTRGAVAFDLMQLLDYDAMAIGNHEFEYGYLALSEEMSRVPFPVLGANLFWRDTQHPFAQPWTIIERDGVRVGVIGVLGQDAATALIPSNIAGVRVEDPVRVLERLVPRLRSEVDLIVVLVHQGPTAPMQTNDEADPSVYRGNAENLTLAGAIPGIDVLLAGHADAGTTAPMVHPTTGTLVMQTWGQGQHLGYLQLELREQGGVQASSGRLIPVNSDQLEPNPLLAKRLQQWRARHPQLQDIVGHTHGALTRRYNAESSLGNLFADIVAQAAGAPIGLMPSGALRRDLPAGAVSREELTDAFPFQDRVARVTVTGTVLLEILEQGFSLQRGLLQVSGLTVFAKPDAEVGERVRKVCVAGAALNPDALYTVGTVEILAQGGDAYRQFSQAEAVEYPGPQFSDAIEAAFAAQRVAVPPIERIRIGGGACTDA